MKNMQVLVTVDDDGTALIAQPSEEGLVTATPDAKDLWEDWIEFDNVDAALTAAKHILTE